MNLKFLIINFIKIILTGSLFRISLMLSTFVLVFFLDPNSYGKWQLIKTTLGFSIILMEFGFFYSFNSLVNFQKYNFRSVLSSVFKFRFFTFLVMLPFSIIYFKISNYINSEILIICVLFFLVIFDYDLALDVIKKNNLLNLTRFLKFTTFVFLILSFSNKLSINFILIFYILSFAISIIFQFIIYFNYEDKNKNHFNFSIKEIFKQNRNYFLIRFFSQFYIFSSLIITPFFLNFSEIAFLGILIALGELILLPTYQIQRFLLPRLLKNNIKQFIYPLLISSMIILIGFLFFLFFGKDLIYLVLKEKYNIALLFFISKFMFLYAFIKNINVQINLILHNSNKDLFLKNITVLVGILSIPFHLFFIINLHIIGVIISIILLEILLLILGIFYHKKKLNI